MFGRFGFWELAIILIIALVIFGPKKLPEMGKALGRGIREFKDATSKLADEINSVDEPASKAGAQKASPSAVAAAAETGTEAATPVEVSKPVEMDGTGGQG